MIYVRKRDGKTMHFDVVVEAATTQEEAIEYGKHYLASVGQGEQKMTQEECQFCYIREAPPALERDIVSKVFLHPKNVRLSSHKNHICK